MKKLIQAISLVGLLVIAGCREEEGIYSPDQKEYETRAKIIQQDYLIKPRAVFRANDPAPNYPVDRLYDKDCPTANEDIRIGL